MTAAAVVFYVLASIAVLSALMVIWSRNVVHSAIYLVLTFLCVAGVYVLLRAEFVAAVQVLASAEQPTAWALNKLIFVGE